MTRAADAFDVVVIGGGPAGSVAATLLADAGHRVAVFERERFPRYHIGESLLSATLPILDAIGATPLIERHGFLRKPGGTFLWGRQQEPWSFWFSEDPGGRPHAYQVVRAEFDTILLDNARAHGADVHEEHSVTAVGDDGGLPVVDVCAVDGATQRLRPRFVIDASGQSALIGRARDLRRFDEFFKNLAVFGYWRDAERLPGELANHILSAAFADGWFWYIPLHDGTMSVGAVVDVRRWSTVAAENPEATYRDLIARSSEISRRLANATLVSPIRIIRDYSYTSTSFTGPGYLMAGDAACFIDPVFSTGVHLASLAGFLGAQAVDGILTGTVAEEEARTRYEDAYRGAFDRYLRFLYFFYDHHVDRDSYFWTARRILSHAPAELTMRESFVRLMSGGGDWDALETKLAREHARWTEGLRAGRASAVPGLDAIRVRSTTELTGLPATPPRSGPRAARAELSGMRVLLVSVNQERSPDPVAPLGLCYVATAAERAGHDVRVLDLCFSTDVAADLGAVIAEHRPEVLGLSLRNVDNCAYPDTISYLPHYRRVVRAVREATPAPVVVGGSAFTTMPAHYLDVLEVPYGVVGEGEVAFVALLRALEARADAAELPGVAMRLAPGRVRVNPPAWLPSLDDLAASRHWIDNRRYFERGGMGNLQTKRGCHFKCTFCAYPVIEGQGMRTRDPALVAAEAERLLDEHGIDQFFIVDSIFNAPRGYAERVAAALRPLGRRVRWSCFVGPGNFTPELADLMLEAGCQSVDFGTDAAAAATLRGFRKSFNVADILAASAVCRERALPFCHSLVFGGEGETWDTVAETIEVMDACRPTAVTAMCGVRVYPETPLARTLLARGEVPSVEALYEPCFYFAPAVREGLSAVVAGAARERGNWLLPGQKVNDEEELLGVLRGRGLKGDMWRYVSRLRMGAALASR